MSRSWVSKWIQRLRQADPEDVMALHSRSRARRTPPVSIASQPAVVQRILEIRTDPPENLQHVPGLEAILSRRETAQSHQNRDVKVTHLKLGFTSWSKHLPSLLHTHGRHPKTAKMVMHGRRRLNC